MGQNRLRTLASTNWCLKCFDSSRTRILPNFCLFRDWAEEVRASTSFNWWENSTHSSKRDKQSISRDKCISQNSENTKRCSLHNMCKISMNSIKVSLILLQIIKFLKICVYNSLNELFHIKTKIGMILYNNILTPSLQLENDKLLFLLDGYDEYITRGEKFAEEIF